MDDEHTGTIQERKKNVTCIVTPDFDQLNQLPVRDTSVPKIKDLLKADSIWDINNLEVSSSKFFLSETSYQYPQSFWRN